MIDNATIDRILGSRHEMLGEFSLQDVRRSTVAEGGCGVIGIASSVPVHGRHLLRSLRQMRNRGNGKGGGAAIAGFDPADLGVSRNLLDTRTMLAVAYLDDSVRPEIETEQIEANYSVSHRIELPIRAELSPPAPRVVIYFVEPRPAAITEFAERGGLQQLADRQLRDEFIYQASFRLNDRYYATLGETRAFVLSHGVDMLALKLVGYGDDVFRVYGLEDLRAHVWIGHHRYPTKGKVWHPGGAHPFVGVNEALVHNGDFANYASVCTYLAQHNIRPLFLTDTEVSVLVFDLLYRTFDYPLEHVIEAMAPTTERDFAMLPAEKQDVYRQLQAAHMHASPDGPWFFLVAQSVPGREGPQEVRLLGITDTSMLRPQVFALQRGEPGMPSIGFAASEQQAIDAALASLSEADDRFWPRPDLVWNARGGSHTDGGAFTFSVERDANGFAALVCRDKFGTVIEPDELAVPYRANGTGKVGSPVAIQGDADTMLAAVTDSIEKWTYADLVALLVALPGSTLTAQEQLRLLTLMLDRIYPTGALRRSSVRWLIDQGIERWVADVRHGHGGQFQYHAHGLRLPDPGLPVVLDAAGYAAEGERSLARELADLVAAGHRDMRVFNVRGQRFLASGLGPESDGVHIDVYGSSGDYFASGIDGAEIEMHGSGQDQLGQIMRRGRLVVHGDVGQTFLYGAKGGQAFVRGNAAGRPLINAVGRPRVVINGTCLDYLAESFMAGDPLDGGGFVVVNGVEYDASGRLRDLSTPYPGGNLFSLPSGGAIFIRDPGRVVGEDQLNGGRFTDFTKEHWALVRPMLELNERLFGIPLDYLAGDGSECYRAIVPAGHHALQPEQAWVQH